jgi:hypothetical protein
MNFILKPRNSAYKSSRTPKSVFNSTFPRPDIQIFPPKKSKKNGKNCRKNRRMQGLLGEMQKSPGKIGHVVSVARSA